jgi:hypothetical protein
LNYRVSRVEGDDLSFCVGNRELKGVLFSTPDPKRMFGWFGWQDDTVKTSEFKA